MDYKLGFSRFVNASMNQRARHILWMSVINPDLDVCSKFANAISCPLRVVLGLAYSVALLGRSNTIGVRVVFFLRFLIYFSLFCISFLWFCFGISIFLFLFIFSSFLHFYLVSFLSLFGFQ